MSDRSVIWQAVHKERRRLVEDLEGLSDEQWQTPSLCPGWSVHDVVAHLIDSAVTTRLGFVRQMLMARLDFDRANDHGVAKHRTADPGDTLEAFREVCDRTDTPPGPWRRAWWRRMCTVRTFVVRWAFTVTIRAST